ncbi:MAG TPA: Ig-like domain repeat protein [Thermomicrobiaceae bacterium]|nr:Ig-like domain repeat protein [Thermomicrobiaceae bacterium]
MASLPTSQQGPTSEALDAVTGALVCSSYFDMLTQYGIEPPIYSGDKPTLSNCVSAALKDAGSNNNVISYATMRSFASCEGDGAQQVNIFVAPGISASDYGQDGTDMCSAGTDGSGSTSGYHGWGLGVPNYTVIPTSPSCQNTSSGNAGVGSDMESLSHEMVELLSDPGGFGWNHGGIGGGATTYDQGELADICSSVGIHPTGDVSFPSTGELATLGLTNLTVAPYWSDQDNACEPTAIMNEVLLPLAGSPSASFSNNGDNVVVPIHLTNPPSGVVDSVELDVVTGSDNLNKCSLANVTTQIDLSGNIINLPQDNANEGAGWGSNTLHAVMLNIPPDLPVTDITQVTLGFSTTCVFGDTWDVAGFELQAAINTNPGQCIPVTELLLNTGNGTAIQDDGWPALHRFKGGHTDSFTLPLPTAPAADTYLPVTGLTLIATTGHDNINSGDEANAQVNTPGVPGSGPSGEFDNINQDAEWNNYTSSGAIQLLQLPGAVLTPGTTAGQLDSFTIYTNFPGGLFGDNWDLLSVVLFAELKCPPSPNGPIVGAVQSTVTGLALSPNPASPNQQVTYTASVNPIPDGGTVAFTSDGSPIPACSAVPVDTTTGFATCTTSADTQPGSDAIVATYSGSSDGAFAASTSNTLYEQVRAPSSVTLTISPNPAQVGDQVTYTASVSPVPDGGTLLFTDNGDQMPSCDSVPVNTTTGQATCVVTYTQARLGDQDIAATFSGDLTYAPSVSSSVTQHVYDYNIVVSNTDETVLRGGSAHYSVSLTLVAGSSTTGVPPITLTAQGLPPDAVPTFSPSSVTPTLAGSSTVLTVQSAGAPGGSLGDSALTITGTNPSGTTRTASAGLHVYDFSVTANPQSLQVLTTGSNTYSISVSLASGSTTTGLPSVSLQLGGLPANTTGTFSVASGSALGFTSTLQITASNAVSNPGVLLTITGIDARTPEGGQRSTQATLVILTPAQALAQIVSKIAALETAGVLNQGQTNSLTVKLNHAIDSLQNKPGQPTACNQLGAFVNEVNAYVKAGTLTSAQAAALLGGPLGVYAIEQAIPCLA